MESLKELLKKVNTTNPTEFDLRVVSIKNFYLGLIKRRDIKKIKRLKLLFHLYPDMLYKNSFRKIEVLVSNPSNGKIYIKNRNEYKPYEIYAIEKYYGANRVGINVNFKVSDLYEYFGIND